MSAAAEADLLPQRRPGRQYEERSRWTKPSDNMSFVDPAARSRQWRERGMIHDHMNIWLLRPGVGGFGGLADAPRRYRQRHTRSPAPV